MTSKMEYIGILFSYVMELFKIEFTIYGFTFSFWQVFVFSIVVSLVCWLLWEVFLGD